MHAIAHLTGKDRLALVRHMMQHLSVLFYAERLALLNLLAAGIRAEGPDSLLLSSSDLTRLLMQCPIDAGAIVVPRAGSRPNSYYFIESCCHDETKTPGRLLAKTTNGSRDIKGFYSTHVCRTKVSSSALVLFGGSHLSAFNSIMVSNVAAVRLLDLWDPLSLQAYKSAKYTFKCMHVCIHACMYACTCARVYVCVHPCMYVCMHVRTRLC